MVKTQDHAEMVAGNHSPDPNYVVMQSFSQITSNLLEISYSDAIRS